MKKQIERLKKHFFNYPDYTVVNELLEIIL